MVYRLVKEQIDKRLYRGKVIIVVGPRQVGKTTLLRMLTADSDRKVVVWNCDEPDVRRKLAEPTSTQLGAETANADLILIDEAQRVQNIGITLKLMVDNYPEKQVVVTGNVCCAENRSKFVLGRSNFVVFSFGKNSQFPEFFIQILHEFLNTGFNHSEVVIFEFLSLWRLCIK